MKSAASMEPKAAINETNNWELNQTKEICIQWSFSPIKKIASLIKTVGFINLNLGLEVVAVTW